MSMRAEIERLRKLVAEQAETISKLEAQAAEIKSKARSGDELRPVPEMDREGLIASLVHWRAEHGVADPQRYLRNRSTDQLRKMYDQVLRDGSVANYRFGRRWKSALKSRSSG